PRRLREEGVVFGALFAAGAVALVAFNLFDLWVLALFALTAGAATEFGRLAFQSLMQRTAPLGTQGRVFVRYEVAFPLAGVMGEFVKVARVSDVPVGEARSFDVRGRVIAVARTGDAWFAFDDTCTHRMCSLGEGEVDGDVIVCPCHGSEFSLATGEPMNGPAD